MAIALGDQAVIAAELIRVDRAALGDLLADHRAQSLPGHMGDRTGRALAPPLQELEHRHFAGRAAPPEALPVTAKVGLVGFDLPLQGRAAFTVLGQVSANHLVDPLGTLAVDVEHVGGLHGRDLQGKEVNEPMELSVR